MPICVHLTTEKNARHIKRSGIKALPWDKFKGVFCMPMMPNYYASHQWLRELKRGLGRERAPLVAIDFKLPSSERVLVGHFSAPHAEVTISQAAKVIMSVDDPLGYEIFLPRAVSRDEIHRVRAVSQVTGWRYYPNSKGRRPCSCCICRGEYGGKKLKQRLNDESEDPSSQPKAKAEIMTMLKEEQDPSDVSMLLFYDLPKKIRRNPQELEFLLNHTSAEVSGGLAYVLRFYRGTKAITMLQELSAHQNEEVRKLAIESIEEIEQGVPFNRITRQSWISINFD